ncbi:16S rRNA (uracil(1498)-N(3))-methyltransferase [Candidatus Gracilibacteria bacterium]|nr:16S rRNA (uracil(1498)-N(3))-methyltransferase [Candidatus Gracilibacteria bacterium]
MQHFFINQELKEGKVVITNEDLLHQMRNVMRFEAGDKCVFLDGKGSKANGVFEVVAKKEAVINLSEVVHCPDNGRKVSLYIALSKKPATLELIVQKATEIGVTDIFPIVTNRCQVKEMRNIPRFLSIISEAAEQSERCVLPVLHEVISWSDFLNAFPKGEVLVGDARQHDVKLGEYLIGRNEMGENSGRERADSVGVSVVIGPEGGLTDEEISDAKSQGAKIFLLGENVLRMETAAISAISMVMFS